MVKPSSKLPKIINQPSMDNHKFDESHLSGAYIRTLVKHLTSIKPKDSSNGDHKLPESVNSNKTQQESSPPPPPPKKQVRRRRQTSKPYQERLLNMAEARREIVTALKFHRASMKQKETTAAAATTASGNYLECCSNLSYSPHHWQMCITSPSTPPPPLSYENNLDFILPNQTLGLNLNFQDFVNLDANLYHNPMSNYSTSSSTSSSSSSSTSSSSAATSLTTDVGVSHEVAATISTSDGSAGSISSGAAGGLHHAVDDDGMEEIRSLGEQHQIEWNDTVNLLTSARWLEFLESIEIEQQEGKFDPPCMDIGENEEIDGEWLA